MCWQLCIESDNHFTKSDHQAVCREKARRYCHHACQIGWHGSAYVIQEVNQCHIGLLHALLYWTVILWVILFEGKVLHDFSKQPIKKEHENKTVYFLGTGRIVFYLDSAVRCMSEVLTSPDVYLCFEQMCLHNDAVRLQLWNWAPCVWYVNLP